MEQTLALIKPDAVKAGRAEEIKQLIELHGFTIMAQQKLQASVKQGIQGLESRARGAVP